MQEKIIMVLNLCCLLQYDVPTHVGVLEEEVKEEIMETDIPSEGTCRCNV